MAWRNVAYSAASKGAGCCACHASISLCGRARGEIETSRARGEPSARLVCDPNPNPT